MDKRAIGVIDSGVGGLTVVKELMKQLPNETIYYLGDTARCPYGPRPESQILQFTWQLVQALEAKAIKMLVIACNTATAVALDDIRAKLTIPVVGVILAGSRAALKATHSGRIGVIGTKTTVSSHAYQVALTEKVPEVSVAELACPKFVPLVESNEYQGALAKKVVAETLRVLQGQKLDTLILGCTHYPLLRPIIQNVMGRHVTLIDSGAETVNEVSMLLDYFQLAAPAIGAQAQHRFYTTGSPKLFQEICESWLGQAVTVVEKLTFNEEKGEIANAT